MSFDMDFPISTSGQIEAELCEQLGKVRLARNITQKQLAQEAGISLRTLVRLEKGEGVSLDSFIRVLQALKLEQSLKQILPDINVRPMDRISNLGRERRKARPKKSKSDHSAWIWGDEKEKPN